MIEIKCEKKPDKIRASLPVLLSGLSFPLNDLPSVLDYLRALLCFCQEKEAEVSMTFVENDNLHTEKAGL